MAKKPPRKPANHVDADKVYNQLSKDLFSALEAANNENLSLASAAVKVAETLADPVAKAKAEAELSKLSKSLKKADRETKSRTRQLISEHAAAKRLLLQTRDTELASIDATDKQARALLRQEYKIKLVELENGREDRLAEALEDFTSSSAELTESALEVIRDLADAQSKAKEEYVSKLDELLEAVDDAADAQRKEFDVQRKRRSKALKDELKKPKNEEEELAEELKSLSGNFFTRNIVRPLMDKAMSAAQERYEDFKDSTGISAIQALLEKERERKDRLDEIQFELAAKKTASEVKAAIEAEKLKHQDPVEEKQEEIRRTVSDIAAQLTALRTTSPLFPALSSEMADDQHLLTFSPTASKTGNTDTAPRPAMSLNDRVTDASEAYEGIGEESDQERELAALEALAQGQKKQRQLGLSEYLMIGGVLAAGVYKALDTMFDKVDIKGGVSKALSLVTRPIQAGIDTVQGWLARIFPDKTKSDKGASPVRQTVSKVARLAALANPMLAAPAMAADFALGMADSATSGPKPIGASSPSTPAGAPRAVVSPKTAAAAVLAQASSMPKASDGTSLFQSASALSRLDEQSASKVQAKYASASSPAALLIESVSQAHMKATGKKPTSKELITILANPQKMDAYMGDGFSAKYTKATGSSLAQQLFTLSSESSPAKASAPGVPTSVSLPTQSATQVNKAKSLDIKPLSTSTPIANASSQSRSAPRSSGVSSTPGLGTSSVPNYAITDPNGFVFLMPQ